MPILTIIENEKETQLPFYDTPTVSELIERANGFVFAPCGKTGHCGKCEIEVSGEISNPNARETELGCRLACQTRLLGNARVRFLAKNERLDNILTESPLNIKKTADFFYGAAVDIGTTTVALKLFNEHGICVAEASDINPQRALSFDVIGRINEALNGKGEILKEQINGCISRLLDSACRIGRVMPNEISRVVITGNTAMLYLYIGKNPESIARAPFSADTLFGCFVNEKTYLSPCINAFNGGDTVCALLYSGMLNKNETALLCDIGTNGELALWKGGKLYVTSAAAGPAFEGGEISQGCGNVLGAIERVGINKGNVTAHTVGNSPAVGICGSGLIDAVYTFLQLGLIQADGYVTAPLTLSVNGGSVVITQDDIRAFQLAKAAIRAATETLLARTETKPSDIQTLYVAGGFGNRISLESAIGVGLFNAQTVQNAKFIGNAALGGACMLLLDDENIKKAEHIARTATHIDLAGTDDFYARFINSIDF